MIIRGPIVPWELGAEKGRPVAAYYGYSLISYVFLIHFMHFFLFSGAVYITFICPPKKHGRLTRKRKIHCEIELIS